MQKSVHIADDWYELLKDEFEKPYFKELTRFVEDEYCNREIFPQAKDIFRAFDCCSVNNLKVVILGQDPYHGAGQANGLCFSVSPGISYPPSLLNIFKEVAACGYTQTPENGDLGRWAEQGVLLLNSVLTVRSSEAASHAGRGWEQFTDAVISKINEQCSGVVYMLWGSYAQRKGAFVDKSVNKVLISVHPSPLSAYRGWFGNGQFRAANDYLQSIDKNPIVW